MIEIRNASKSFGPTMAVDNVSLTIRDGELFGLLGPNGAGKSTLIRMITGLLAQDGGSVSFFDGPAGTAGPLDAKAVKRMIGLVPQDLAFYQNYSAIENVKFFASLYGLRGKALTEAAEAALAFAGLSDTGKKPAKAFSGGMKRRLNIACGIAHDPRVVILDEPTVGIDPQSRNHILRSVEELRRRGRTIIYTTHYMEEAENLCTEIAIMDKGKIIAQGSQERLKLLIKDSSGVTFTLKRPDPVDLGAFKRIRGVTTAKLDELRLCVTSEVGATNLNELTAEVNRQGLIVTDIETDSPSLETVFLSLTGRSLRD
ncbi:MAG TPA: ABC transporter ATP-binding protein [Spirochaetales bacterium]|nr:ABC transporter ATP-binding protein [Spirochaetales bacterium]HPG86192.1 ABC transporter ATP-binding protein [Spirochaetales bacterium]HPM71656.1 ABC transporter ATP-binding protein [Spirochaetales bacterium]